MIFTGIIGFISNVFFVYCMNYTNTNICILYHLDMKRAQPMARHIVIHTVQRLLIIIDLPTLKPSHRVKL